MTDLTTLSADDLDALEAAVMAEKRRRFVLETAAQQVDNLHQQVVNALGRQPGDPWVQPLGQHDAYRLGETATHAGKSWTASTDWNVWEPGVAGWRETPTGTPAEWVQPTGAADAYNTGDLATFEGQIFESTIDGNVWSPTAYPAGWRLVS